MVLAHQCVQRAQLLRQRHIAAALVTALVTAAAQEAMVEKG